MENTLYELALQDEAQLGLVDMITKDAPVLESVPFFPTTHGHFNVYERLIDVDALVQMDFDSAYTEIGSKTEKGQTDIAKYGGKMTAGKDAIEMLYPGMSFEDAVKKYFATKISKIARVTAESIDYALIYNFLRSIANSAGKMATASGSNNHNYSVICARWEEGENCGLYNPNKKTDKDITKLVEFYLLNGGVLGNVLKNGVSIPGAEAILETFFGFQLPNTNHISGIKNIDLDLSGSPATEKNPPTSKMFDKMLRDAKAKGDNTFIYCHAAVADYMSDKYATSVTKGEVGFANYKMVLKFWKDIPIITSENFLDALEPNL